MAVAPFPDDFSHIVKQNERANGFAVIISNDYANVPTLTMLKGPLLDATCMKSALEQLNFAVLHRHNIGCSELMKLLTETAHYNWYPPSYRRLVVVFSGHGTNGYQLYTKDGKLVKIEDMLKIFHPANARIVGSFPKLFFIDACRGDANETAVVVPKGGKEVTSVPVPSQGNFLVAYSTTPGHLSFETPENGGVWMSLLAKRLRSDNNSILDILTRVNQELQVRYEQEPRWRAFMQQPELISRLNEEVNLLREARNEPNRCSLRCCSGTPTNLVQLYDQPHSLPAQFGWSTPTTAHSSTEVPGQLPASRNKTGPPTNFPTPTSSSSASCSSEESTNPYKTTPPRSSDNPRRSDSSPPQISMAMTRGTSPKLRMELYCQQNKKPTPTYQCQEVEPGLFVATVYVAKTHGRVKGGPKPDKEAAEEDAAAELLKKLKIV